ncbi:hypothetical protein B4U80_02800 [Leptotrombidium deliense]|uniref:Peptidase S1 domain-containing protein n=1 Tax=Leptotrombidium deliense TaxID=299467 RepID=A0A443S4K2_9ACAR|nr:hypothetical protein B4U80_02800 [Leptotrombidium deliense]
MYINTQQRHDCERLYAHLGFWSKQVCTHANGNGICQGDSGGPLSSRIRGAVTQVGINSWVISGTCGQHPDVTTRVSEYLNDIYTVTQGANWCQNPN